jgi:hypothetical protein
MTERYAHIVMNQCLYLWLLIIRYCQPEIRACMLLTLMMGEGIIAMPLACRYVQRNQIVTVR